MRWSGFQSRLIVFARLANGNGRYSNDNNKILKLKIIKFVTAYILAIAITIQIVARLVWVPDFVFWAVGFCSLFGLLVGLESRNVTKWKPVQIQSCWAILWRGWNFNHFVFYPSLTERHFRSVFYSVRSLAITVCLPTAFRISFFQLFTFYSNNRESQNNSCPGCQETLINNEDDDYEDPSNQEI